MKKVLIVIGVLVLLFLVINQLFINTYDGSVFSDSKEQSKKNGYFICDYIPSKDTIRLLKRTIKSPALWIEKAQQSDHFLVFFSKKNVDPYSYNFILESTNSCSSNEYLFDLAGSYQVLNCINNFGFIYKAQWSGDSIKIYVKQGDPELGWQKETVVDSLVYHQNR